MATKRPYQLPAVTAFRSDDKIIVDSQTNGTGAMSKDSLLAITEQNTTNSTKFVCLKANVSDIKDQVDDIVSAVYESGTTTAIVTGVTTAVTTGIVLEQGVKYRLSMKTDTLISKDGIFDCCYALPTDSTPMFSIKQASAEDLYNGIGFVYTPTKECTWYVRTYQTSVIVRLEAVDLADNKITPLETDVGQLKTDVSDLSPKVYDIISDVYESTSKAIVTGVTTAVTTGIVLKQNVKYRLSMKTDTLITKDGTFDCCYAFPTDSSPYSVIKQSTAADLYSGIAFVYTPTKDSTWYVRTFQASVTVRLEAVDLDADRITPLESAVASLAPPMRGKTWACYGDSITAISNGDGLNLGWAKYVNESIPFVKFYGRGAGGQRYNFGLHGGSVVFVDSVTGEYNSRDDGYNKDDYTGAIPAGCVAVRGALSSWDRITHMFPASIKDNIDVVCIMGGTNDVYSDTAPEFVANSTIDAEWATSGADYYGQFNGDYNILTFAGGIASCIMKMQLWMPQAVIVVCTPLSGRGTTGQKSTDLDIAEYPKTLLIKEMAERTSCPCIDVFGTCGISPFNRDEYITDAVHPYSDAGKKMLARAFIMGLKNIEPMID